jgi:hypothetical protein
VILCTEYVVKSEDAAGRNAVTSSVLIQLEQGAIARLWISDSETRLTIERRVALANVRLADGVRGEGSTLVLDEDEFVKQAALASTVVDAIAFIRDARLSLRRPDNVASNRLLPEAPGDRDLLAQAGTDAVASTLGVQWSVRTFGSVEITGDAIGVLLGRRSGLSLYADALHLDSPIAKYRELWKVLESAFGAKDRSLLKLLADFPPLMAMEVKESELKELWVLRGRASHAESKKGMDELAFVRRECSHRMTRLKNFVERVILTKEIWGVPSIGISELAPLRAYMRENGRVAMFVTEGAAVKASNP